jgi:uncharacterized membrane protein YeaQ/YmgE (transglycosylase-associated protein family)
VPGAELSPAAQQWTGVILIWLGFGILTGLLTKALIPGREPAGAVGTLLIGMLGSVLGPLALSGVYGGRDFNPIGPLGILAAVASAVILLLGYRVLVTYVIAARPEDREE